MQVTLPTAIMECASWFSQSKIGRGYASFFGVTSPPSAGSEVSCPGRRLASHLPFSHHMHFRGRTNHMHVSDSTEISQAVAADGTMRVGSLQNCYTTTFCTPMSTSARKNSQPRECADPSYLPGRVWDCSFGYLICVLEMSATCYFPQTVCQGSLCFSAP